VARRRKERKKEEFNSFIDIMTCLAGILILIILLVIVQIQEVRVLIPTPMEYESGKAPVFVEARNNMLYTINLDRIKDRIETAISELTTKATDDDGRLNQREFLRQLGMLEVYDESHIVDLSFYLMGQYALRPNPEVAGYPLPDIHKEKETDWFGAFLRSVDKEREMITFIVRDDSFDVFRNARSLAWIADVEVSWYLVAHNEPIKFGLSGEAPISQ
jgi:hypothetical protein